MLNYLWQQQEKLSNNRCSLFFGKKSVTITTIMLLTLVVPILRAADTMQEYEDTVKLYHSPSERRDKTTMTLMDGVTAGILIEAEAAYSKQGNAKNSDITLATFEFVIDAELTDSITGHILMLWEEDDTEPVDLDEGSITIGLTDSCPFYATAGKMYVPFGAFNSHFISDPLVLELAETRASTLILGFANDILDANVSAFNGKIDDGTDDQIDNVSASITINPAANINIGAFWISDMGESGTLEEVISNHLSTDETLSYKETSGAGAFASLKNGCIQLEIEYITAMDHFKNKLLTENSQKPSALNLELALHCFKTWEVSIKYETSSDFLNLPNDQYGMAATYALNDFSTISIEYLKGNFADETPTRDLITTQLAMKF